MYYKTMENIENFLNKAIGDRIDVSLQSTVRVLDNLGLNQKQLSIELQNYGWKKDYNHPGEWVRVSKWKYLSYYEAKKIHLGISLACSKFRKHSAGVKEIKNKDVTYYCEMPIPKNKVGVIMKSFGYTLEKNTWRKE